MSSIFNHTASYLSETSGAFTLLYSVGTGAECVDYFTGKKSPLSDTIQKVFGSAAVALTWPCLMSDALELAKEWSETTFLSLSENIANALEYVNENHLAELSSYIPVISTIGNGSCILAEGIRMYREANVYFDPAELDARKNLSLIRIVEKVYAICRAVLNIGVSLVGLAVLPQVKLFLTVNWLVARTANYLYEKMAVL